MRVLVTGGAGFIGSHLVDGLLAAGYEVRVLDALASQVHGSDRKRPDHLAGAAELVVGDVGDRGALARALDGVEAVFHQAAAVGLGQSMYEIERFVRANSVGTAVLLEELVARRRQVRRLVVASSMSLYGEGAYRDAAGRPAFPPPRPATALAAGRYEPCDEAGAPLAPVPTPETAPLHPTSVYAVTKRDCEELCLTVGEAYGIPTVALRYFNVYGPRQALSNPYTGALAIFSARILNGRPPLVYEDGCQTRDFVHVSDVVRANLLALERPEAAGRVYNVGTGVATSVLELAERLGAALGFAGSPGVPGRFRAGDIRHCTADVSRIRQELGYAPRISLAEGLHGLVDWVRNQSAEDGLEHATRELAERGLAR